jgi:hypothetical protein
MVVSVSPYAFSSRAQGAARSAARQTAASACSPPVIISRTLRSRSSAGRVCASICCQYAGVRSMTVIRLPATPRSTSEGAVVPGDGSISVAPRVSATNICSIDVSKAMAASCATRSSSPIAYSRATSPMTQARLP